MALWVLAALWSGEETEVPERLLDGLLPPMRRARLTRANAEKRRQAFAAYALLRRGTARFLGVSALPEVSLSPQGKPFFAEYPALCFSLSHTRGAALCAFCDQAVGADVERIRPVPPERAQRLQLSGQPEAFFVEWVERESRAKCRGDGALLCRRPVAAEAGERYAPLPLGSLWAAGVCAASDAPARLETMALSELLAQEEARLQQTEALKKSPF